jgi:hypothetical protein
VNLARLVPEAPAPDEIRAKFILRNRSFVSRHDFDVKTKSSRSRVRRLLEVGFCRIRRNSFGDVIPV